MLGYSAFEVTALSGFDVYKQSGPVQLLHVGGFHPQGAVGPLGQGVEVVAVTAAINDMSYDDVTFVVVVGERHFS